MLNRKAKTTSELTYTGNRFKTSGQSKLTRIGFGKAIKQYLVMPQAVVFPEAYLWSITWNEVRGVIDLLVSAIINGI